MPVEENEQNQTTPAPSLTKEGSKGSTSKGSPSILGGGKEVVNNEDKKWTA
jgi:hypothetical protein